MKIFYMSQRDAELLYDNLDNSAIISICDAYRGANIKTKRSYSGNGFDERNILRLNFDDLCPKKCSELNRYDLIRIAKFFTKEQAKLIIDKVTSLPPNIDTIYVHCRQGRSRSVAVANFLAEIFETEAQNASMLKEDTNPNPHVYVTLLEVYNENSMTKQGGCMN